MYMGHTSYSMLQIYFEIFIFFYQEKKMKNEQTRGSAKVCYVALWLFPPG